MLKRCFDLAAAVIGLIMIAPLLLLIAVVIRISDGRPVLFRQQRIGRRGIPFDLYKFRTMTVSPVRERGAFDAGDSSRVTRIGRLLRKTKLDELPQLWNVVRGEMSLVGPRPEVAQWVLAFPDRWSRVHQVRPGLTDPASIAYRDEEETLAISSDPQEMYATEILPRKLSLYEDYISTRSFGGDLGIIFRTLLIIIQP